MSEIAGHGLVGHFTHSAFATNGLDQKQKAFGFKPVRHVVQGVSTRWNSTFRMLQRLVLLKQPIRLYLEDNMSEKERASYDLTDIEWASAKSVLSLLEAIDEVTTTLSGEPYHHLIWRIILHFLLVPSANVRSSGQSRHRSPGLVDVHARWHKKQLESQINGRFHLDSLEMDSPPVLAAALDPRFRKLSFLSPAQRSEVKKVLEEKASTGGDSCTSTSPSSSSNQPPCKKKKPSVLDSLLGEEDSSDNEGGSIMEEVALYLDERPIKRKENPIAWWKGNANRFPRLAPLAR